MAKKKPFKTEQEEAEYHLELPRDMLRKLTALAKDEPEFANQLLGHMMLSAELLVSNVPEFKEEFHTLVKEIDQEVRTAANLPWQPAASTAVPKK